MELLIISALLVIAAETTYLVVAQTIKFKHSKKQHMPIFVDTSVLIDGRIISIAESGFITSTLFIPRSVVGELQFLADNADTEKRSRARHGLDIVKELQAMTNVNVEIFNDGTKAEEGVDNRLLKLAKEYNGAVCTIDYNLNKVAQVENIVVLNVNDLAKTLRMAYLPGEKIKLELTQKGNDHHQAVGHLDDGTMVVVEHASTQIGKIVEIEFIRGLQTAAGKMMFARLVGGGDRDLAKKAATQQPKGTAAKAQLPRIKTKIERAPRAPRNSAESQKSIRIHLVELAHHRYVEIVRTRKTNLQHRRKIVRGHLADKTTVAVLQKIACSNFSTSNRMSRPSKKITSEMEVIFLD
jgi:rRNA-processing protein FCF1